MRVIALSKTNRITPLHEEALVGVLIGAGLSKAVIKDSPSWAELLKQAAARMKESALDAIFERHLLAYAYILGRKRPPQRSAEPTDFQRIVSDILNECRHACTDYAARLQSFSPHFANFIKKSRARVLIDLNYDSVLEDLLDDARIPYIRRLGSEFRWTEPVSDEVVLVWKIHGSIRAASTIVISPSEYQLVYEFNALGNELARVGADLARLWTLGVGLEDDDVWVHLCREAAQLEVYAVWLSTKDPSTLEPWGRLITSKVHKAVVLQADRSAPIEVRLADLCTLLQDERVRRAAADVFSVSLGKRFRNHVHDFESRYREMGLKGIDGKMLMPIVNKFRGDYGQLKELLLSVRAGSIGPTWCPALRHHQQHPAASDEQRRIGLDFLKVFKNADELAGDWNDKGGASVLVLSACQAAVVHVTELAEVLGLNLRVELDYERAKDREVLLVPRNEPVMVGCNPFDSPNLPFSNLMHLFKGSSKAFKVPGAVFGNSAARPIDRATRLVSEDEWEASVIRMYNFYEPKVSLTAPRQKGEKKQRVDSHLLRSIPPLYPWGFRLLDIQEYRKRRWNRVTREWALVGSGDGEGKQYCKGGGLRDRSARTFTIGGRGLLRIGEYDDFLFPAYFEEAE